MHSFDYLARLVGFLTLGSKGPGLKWNALVNHARSGAPALHQIGLTQLIIRMDREFVSLLQEYRGDLIHRDPMMGTIEGSLHFCKERVAATIVVSAPDALAKVLTGKASFRDQPPPYVLVASATLIQATIECGFSLMRALAKPTEPSA